MNDYKTRRKEFQSAKFHKQLPVRCGTVCVNCGDDSEIEYHHVVPLGCGGTNNFSNIVPLCATCHMKIHMSEFMKANRNAKQKKVGGRKRICPDNYKEILDDYLHCRISKSECKERLGVTCNFVDTVWFREYLEERNIERYRNNIDLHNSRKTHYTNPCRGWIEYKDGTVEHFVA